MCLHELRIVCWRQLFGQGKATWQHRTSKTMNIENVAMADIGAGNLPRRFEKKRCMGGSLRLFNILRQLAL